MPLTLNVSPGKGLGVFAAEDIHVHDSDGQVIVSMDICRMGRSSLWKDVANYMKLPDDSGVHCCGARLYTTQP